MKSRLDAWIQIATTIAVIIGLGLVIFELRQTKELARLVVTQTSHDEIAMENIAILGENAASVLRKACIAPESLTDDEYFVLEHYFRIKFVRVLRYKEQDDLAGFGNPWREEGRLQLSLIMRFPQGKNWLRTMAWPDPEVQALLTSVLDGPPAQTCDSVSRLKTG